MRNSCLDCCRKHVSAALILSLEVLQGYPIHAWIAIGHLSEASDEIIKDYPALAERVREERLNYMISVNRSLRYNEENEEFNLTKPLYEMNLLQIIQDVTIQHISDISDISDIDSNDGEI